MHPNNHCPICGIEKIAAHMTRCPQCDADLTCFQVLQSLPEEAGIGRRGQLFLLSLTLSSVFITFTVLGLFWRLNYRLNLLETRVSNQKEAHQDLAVTLSSQLQEVVNSPRKKVNSIDSARQEERPESPKHNQKKDDHSKIMPQTPDLPEKLKFRTYCTTEKDTLWLLSRKFYGAGKYYPILMEHNPQLGVYDLDGGITIKILEDKNLVKQMYHSIIETQEQQIFYLYTVQEGDTLTAITAKFYQNDRMIDYLTELNPGTPIRPGQKIKILLE
ncbi:LysM peptidoglycan-binding domain-containing protein [candidate division CSSED10-310 bacterium]|uniref:LysM peptidoglycan-binding domain-containing protein n=1 Tax=candidate division CSSED10-310 bacterium TaxID=2855610 RepID=A0ABV6YZG5_UNCC1